MSRRPRPLHGGVAVPPPALAVAVAVLAALAPRAAVAAPARADATAVATPPPRLRLAATVGVDLGDELIRRSQLGLGVALALGRGVSLGVEASTYDNQLDPAYDRVARDERRLVAVNRYRERAALTVEWTALDGALAAPAAWRWDLTLGVGLGVVRSESLPRDPAHQPFTHLALSPSVGLAGRLHPYRWLALELGVRDEVAFDRLESADRTEPSAAAARADADRVTAHALVVRGGLAVALP